MLPIHWSVEALDNLDEIVRYIAKHNPAAARRMHALLEGSVDMAAEYPQMYRTSQKVPGTREIIAHPNYRVFYRVLDDAIEVVAVVHVRRKYP